MSVIKAGAPRAERFERIARVLWITLVLNWLVAFLKIVLGFSTQCMVIVADGLHSFSDGSSNIAGLAAIRVAKAPPDEDHPYGHEKFETLAAAVIAFMLFLAAFGIAKEAVISFFHPKQTQITPSSFAVMFFTLGVNFFVAFYERGKGRELKSDFLLGDAWHTATDILVTIGVLVAMVGISRGIPYLDSIFSLTIAVIIVLTAVQILKRSTDVLVDKAMLDAKLIDKAVRAVPGVLDCHEIRTRGKADRIYVDMHVLVDPKMSVKDSHQVANLIEKKIRDEFSAVADVVVHIEPLSHEHDELDHA